MRTRRPRAAPVPRSAFASFRFPSGVMWLPFWRVIDALCPHAAPPRQPASSSSGGDSRDHGHARCAHHPVQRSGGAGQPRGRPRKSRFVPISPMTPGRGPAPRDRIGPGREPASSDRHVRAFGEDCDFAGALKLRVGYSVLDTGAAPGRSPVEDRHSAERDPQGGRRDPGGCRRRQGRPWKRGRCPATGQWVPDAVATLSGFCRTGFSRARQGRRRSRYRCIDPPTRTIRIPAPHHDCGPLSSGDSGFPWPRRSAQGHGMGVVVVLYLSSRRSDGIVTTP